MTSGKKTWMWQALSGLALVLLLGLHLFVNHFLRGGLLTFDDVQAYVRQPWAAALEFAFLVTVVYHAMVGVRAILLDTRWFARRVQAVNRALFLLGAALVAYGGWLLFAIQRHG